MGKALLYMISAFAIIGSYRALDTQHGVLATRDRISRYEMTTLARLAAKAGYQAALEALHRNFTSHELRGVYEGGTYEVDVSVDASSARITSRGTMIHRGNVPLTFTIEALYERKLVVTITEEPPPFLRYALLSDGDLSLRGNILSDILVQGVERSMLNANMHTNGNLFINGNSVTVRGFGTFTGSGSAKPAKALRGSFKPNYNPGKEATARWAEPVPIPTYDAPTLTSRITVDTTTAGDTYLAGDYPLSGTREDPHVWHVKGNLYVTADTHIDGYALFLVDGSIDFAADVRAGDIGYDGPEESSLAFYAGGSVSFGSNQHVYGQILAGGDVVFMSGTPHVYGSITTRAAADLRGTPKIHYRPASSALATVWQTDGITEFILRDYREW